ncbi:hypothetical protein UlMin_004722 [Ulmus minor]
MIWLLSEQKGEIGKAVKCLEAICQSQVSFFPIVEVKTRLRIATLLLQHSHNPVLPSRWCDSPSEARSVGGFGFQCGLVAGIFSLTRCGLQRYRRKSDLVNGLIVGAVAGAAVAARTRSLTQVLGTACLVSAFSAAADYSRSI